MPKELDLAKVKDIIGFVPHAKQVEVLQNMTRFTTLCWGRRSGKTMLGAYLALIYLLTENHNIWIVAPTYDLSKKIWNYLTLWVPKINKEIGQFIKVKNAPQFTMETYGGSKLELKSADNPASLLGEGLDLLILDEAARLDEGVWRQQLRPTLSDRQGKAMFISTPLGKNWFYVMKQKGENDDEKDYSYFHMKTEENTSLLHIQKEVESARMDIPANDFLQEYEAEFIDGAGTVFRGVRDVLFRSGFVEFPWYNEYNESHPYQGGVDLARLQDFTVQTVFDKADMRVVGVDRFSDLDYKVQKPRLNLISEKFRNPRIYIERNNVGDMLVEDLPSHFEAFTTTERTKKDLINNLMILIEQRKIQIPDIPMLVSELESFTYEILPGGTIRYGAPSGMHDDMVMSLALAVKDVRAPAQTEQFQSYTMPTPVAPDNDW